MLSKPEGITAEIQLKNSTGLTFDWVVNGVTAHTTEPRLNIKSIGRLDVSVVVKNSAGESSSSRAIYSVSVFSIVNGKAKYSLLERAYLDLDSADMSTFKVLGVNTAADANQLYLYNSGIKILKVPNALAAKELSPNYTVANGVVYFQGVAVPNALADSFTVVSDAGYAKDSARVYCLSKELQNADPQSFQAPSPGIQNFARDKSNLYSGCAPLRAYDPNAFSVIKNTLLDPNTTNALVTVSGKIFLVGGAKDMDSISFTELPFIPTDSAKLKIVSSAPFRLHSYEVPYALVTDGTNFAGFRLLSTTAIISILKISQPVDLESLAYVKMPVFLDKDHVFVWDQLKATLNVLTDAQSSNFAFITDSFFRSGSIAYFISSLGAWTKLSGVDGATLSLFVDNIYKDSARVYLLPPKSSNLQVIPDANPATFASVGSGLYKDGGNVWYTDKTNIQLFGNVEGANLKLLSATGEGVLFTDSTHVYLAFADAVTHAIQSNALAVTNPAEIGLVTGLYIANSNTVYYLKNHSAIAMVGASPVGLKIYSPECLGADTKLICFGNIVADVDPTKLVAVGHSYYKNATSVFYFPTRLDNVQTSTFRLVNPALSDFYSTDGIHVWYRDILLPMADVATFRVVGLLTAEDQTYNYTLSNATKK